MAGRGSSLPSVMTKDFSKIPAPNIQRSVFNRTHGHKTTFDAGYLVPFLCQEILPGDTMNLHANIFARISTLVFPIMDNVFLDFFFFFVPNRLVWDNWERFCGAQDDPDDSIDFEVPVVNCTVNGSNGYQPGTLYDYFGLPLNLAIATADLPSALPFRAYNLIYNSWFRDQNLQNSVVVNTDDGPDDDSDNTYSLLRRGKRHDYFTSCLPEPQKGDGVSLPLGVSAPVIGNGLTIGLTDGAATPFLGGLRAVATTGYFTQREGAYGVTLPANSDTGTAGAAANLGLTLDPDNSGMIADLSLATAATINDLREAFATQQFLERDARGGTRYVESLKSHFGVTSPDFRLQRPEYLGGGSERISVSAVAQTTPAATPTGTDALGVLGAYGQVGAKGGFGKSFVEHGYVIGIVNVRADITYQQGIDRHWTRRTRFDFYWPEFAHIGEQAVLNREIFYADTGTDSNVVFGYQERWAEYRYQRSYVTGLFRSDAAASLEKWHLAIDFAAQPALNAAFIVDDPDIDRVIAVPSEPHVLFDSFIQIKHARPMPVYSVPGLTRL